MNLQQKLLSTKAANNFRKTFCCRCLKGSLIRLCIFCNSNPVQIFPWNLYFERPDFGQLFCYIDIVYVIFFNCYLAVPRPILGYYRADNLTQPMLITTFFHCRLDGRREPRSGVESLGPTERLVGFEQETFRFWL